MGFNRVGITGVKWNLNCEETETIHMEKQGSKIKNCIKNELVSRRKTEQMQLLCKCERN